MKGVTEERRLGCPTSAKVGYGTRSEARRVARSLRKRRGRAKDGHVLDVYRCDCGLFHLGNRSATKRRDGGSLPVKPKRPVPAVAVVPAHECAKRFGGNHCAFVPMRRVIAGREVWLCDQHWLELTRLAERIRQRRAA